MDNKITAIIKFVLFILLLPVVAMATISFMSELQTLPKDLTSAALAGILVFLVIHLFIYELQPFYQYGQSLVASMFRFFPPLIKTMPFLLPVFSILFLVLFYFLTVVVTMKGIGNFLFFLSSFTLIMHLVFTAKTLREKDNNAVKPDYFFAMCIIYIAILSLIAFLLALIVKDFSFANFFIVTLAETAKIYQSLFEQLFVP